MSNSSPYRNTKDSMIVSFSMNQKSITYVLNTIIKINGEVRRENVMRAPERSTTGLFAQPTLRKANLLAWTFSLLFSNRLNIEFNVANVIFSARLAITLERSSSIWTAVLRAEMSLYPQQAARALTSLTSPCHSLSLLREGCIVRVIIVSIFTIWI